MRLGSCPPPQLPQPGPSRRSMRRIMATPLPILLTLILLPPIAFASPPDPSWIAGFYDGADGDDVVNLVYESSAANSAAPSHTRPFPWLLVSLQGIVRNVAASGRFTLGPRSPPVLCSPEFADVFNSLSPPKSSGTLPNSPVDHQVRLFPVPRPPRTSLLTSSSQPSDQRMGRRDGGTGNAHVSSTPQFNDYSTMREERRGVTAHGDQRKRS
jgi:hypothetical protein